MRKILFIEGTASRANGDLRSGFGRLISKALPGKRRPKIIMGGGKSMAIEKFSNGRLQGDRRLLIDLDGPTGSRKSDLENHALAQHSEAVFYMVQEMEAWFFSQPEILEEFYGPEIAKSLPGTFPADISEPDKVLENITRKTQKGKYHKVRHGTELLARLDPGKLENTFPDFKRLLKAL